MFAYGQIYKSSTDFVVKCNSDVSKINGIINKNGNVSTSDESVRKAMNDGCITIVEGNGYSGFISNKLEIKP